MMTITPAAANQIRTASVQGNAIGAPLRIAIQPQADGSLHYLMGFDEQQLAGDTEVVCEGVKILIDLASEPFAKGMTLDFVDLEGAMEFIFLNPNDPHYRPPQV